jgi:SAM-dependent methyltransferase
VLPRARYTRAFEPGCSFGVLTELLAPRCDALIASEVVPSVAARARQRLEKFAHVDVDVGAIPDGWPGGTFDLVVLSEVLYYLTDAGAREVHTYLEKSTAAGAHIVAVHYCGETDYPRTGDAVHARLREQSAMRRLGRYEEDLFVIDLFEKVIR